MNSQSSYHSSLSPLATIRHRTLVSIVIVILLLLAAVRNAGGHCDSLDGPVVEAAKAAIAKSDVTPVLKWVDKDGEKEIRDAFALTMKARAQGDEARKLADTHFFETLVRVHRAGEGEPYTGLKPAGTTDPGLLVADKALQGGSVDKLAAELAASVQEQVRKRFAEVIQKRKHADDSVEAGRAYVAAYVQYAHFVETLHKLASRPEHEHHGLHSAHAHGE